MTKGKILIVGSNAKQMDIHGGFAETGNYLNETVVPAMALIAAGYEVVLTTPNGERPTLDAKSDTASHFGGDAAAHARARDFWTNDPAMNHVHTLKAVIAGGLNQYVGLFVPGGHAPVVDLMQDRDLGIILRHFHDAAKPTGLLCHGPIATAAAVTDPVAFRAALVDGNIAEAAALAKGWPYAGYRMTVFSTSEEQVVEDNVLHARLYFYMPDALRTAGGDVTTGADWEPNVVIDRELITGQNPRSDKAIAEALIAALAKQPVEA